MKCSCGYVFQELPVSKTRDFESYIVVNNKDYQNFLRKEVKVLESSKEDRLSAIARSAEYAGNLYACPGCGLLTIVWPGGEKGVYQKE